MGEGQGEEDGEGWGQRRDGPGSRVVGHDAAGEQHDGVGSVAGRGTRAAIATAGLVRPEARGVRHCVRHVALVRAAREEASSEWARSVHGHVLARMRRPLPRHGGRVGRVALARRVWLHAWLSEARTVPVQQRRVRQTVHVRRLPVHS